MSLEVSGAFAPRRVAVFGLGYVGCVTAACLARLGHRVTGIDRDEYKVDQIRRGCAPFYEPGLTEVLAEAVQAGRLTATTEVAEGLVGADVALLCVGTPSERSGNLGLEQLRRVSQEIGIELQRTGERPIIAVRSTVFPGTCEEVVQPHVSSSPVVANPEFLREGQAMRDFLEPSLIVVGGSDEEAIRVVADLYAPLGVEPSLTRLRTAEMIKYACNAFHAVKIDFANEIGSLCEGLEIPPDEVMGTLCKDTKLNASAAYLKPGFAFGGSCLGKDMRALLYRASRMELKLPLLEAVLPSNQQHLHRAIEAALELPAQRIGIYGLAFKEDTDDLRESPAVTLVEQLLGKGRELRIYDPYIQIDQIYGSNRNFVLRAIPHIGRLMAGSVEELLNWADQLILVQKPRPEHRGKVNGGLPILDLTTVPPALPTVTRV